MDLYDEYGYPLDTDMVESILAAPNASEVAGIDVYDKHGSKWRPRTVERIRAAAAAGDFISDFELSIWQHSVLPGDTAEMLGDDPAQATGETDLDPEILEYLVSDDDFDVRVGAVTSPVRSEEEAFEILASDAFADDLSDRARSALVGSSDGRWIAPHTCHLLARSLVEVHRTVAAQASTDAAELLDLAEDVSGLVRRAACANHSAPEEIRRRTDDLRQFQDRAMDGETPPAVLAKLATDRDERVRRLVAENPSTPTRALWKLVGWVDDHHLVENPQAPPDLVEAIADRSSLFDEQVDDSYSLLGAFARSTQAPPRVFYRLAELFRDDSLLGDDTAELRQVLLSNHSVPSDLLASYADHPSDWVRRTVACNPSTDSTLLEALVEDPADRVRQAATAIRDNKLRANEIANRTPAEQQAIDAAVEAHMRWLKRIRFTRPFTYRHITSGIRQHKRVMRSINRAHDRAEKHPSSKRSNTRRTPTVSKGPRNSVAELGPRADHRPSDDGGRAP